VPPAEFAAWQETAIKIGFTKVASSPFVRSSYKAAQGGISLTAKP
jgi:lipoate synthase